MGVIISLLVILRADVFIEEHSFLTVVTIAFQWHCPKHTRSRKLNTSRDDPCLQIVLTALLT